MGQPGGESAGVDDIAEDALRAMAELAGDDPLRARLRDRVIRAYLPFARRVARRFAGRGEPLEDLIQVATLALIKSVDRFDVTRGIPFTAFAGPTMLGELKRHFRDRAWSLRVGRGLQELNLEIGRVVAHLAQELGRSVTVADIAARMGIGQDEVLAGLECGAAYSPRSLSNLAATDEGSSQLGELIGEPDPELECLVDRQALHQAIHELPEREQRILSLRFFGNLTQSQIGQRIGVSQMHVSRLLTHALSALRTRLLAVD